MKCQKHEDLFLVFNQMLGPDEAERMRRHLKDCAECAELAEEYRKLDSALDDWVAAGPSPWFDARWRARVEAHAQKRSRFFGFGRARSLAVGVAAIILIVVAVVDFSHQEVVEINHQTSSLQQPVAITAGPRVPAATEAVRRPLPAEEQLKMDENLSLLEDYDIVSNFDALSELPQANEN